jgi:predicted MPP superfamily phosphohydrolase
MVLRRATSGSVAALALGSYALGVAVAGWGIWVERRRLKLRRIEVSVGNLPAAFDGYRIVQLSDLHIGSYDGVARGLRWAAAANALGADLAVVTGDLVTDQTCFYDDAARVVASLTAPDGVYVCMGNHDQWDNDAFTAKIEALGPRVLRNASTTLERGSAELVVAGLGDRFTRKDDIDATLAGRPAGAPTVLLAHYPVSFDSAAERGVELVLSGHTHGGQIGLPFVGERVNVATRTGQHRRGVYRRGRSWLYVNAGLGTTGPPIRVGIAPEIALIVLKRVTPGGAGTQPG